MNGSITDQDVHNSVTAVLQALDCGTISRDQAYTRLDAMTFTIWNRHVYGMAAKKALDEVSKAIDGLPERGA